MTYPHQHIVTVSVAIGVAVGYSVGWRNGLDAFAASILVMNAMELLFLLVGGGWRRSKTVNRLETKPATKTASVFGEEVFIPMWDSRVPIEMPYVIAEDELFPPGLTSRKRSLRKQYIRENSAGRFGEMTFEDPNNEHRTIYQWVFENESFALGLKMGLWPEEMQ